MESNEKNLSHLESLNLIRDTISRTKENFRDNSFYFLLWGWLVAFSSFAFFILHQYTAFEFYFLPFPVLGVTGVILTVVHYRKQRSVSPTESYSGYYLSRLWLVLGLNFIAVVFINVSQHNAPFTYTLILAGIGTLVSGLVMQFKPMIWGGILFLVSALISIYIPENYKVLLHGTAVVTGYLIPGYLLKHTNR